MKINLQWMAKRLKNPGNLDPQAVEQALINAGLPLESNTPQGDTHILDVEVTSNRSDCLSHLGMAREVAALLGGTLHWPPLELPPEQASAPPAGSLVSVQIENPALCSYYSARLIQNVKVGPSPEWLVKYLESIGLRSVNNVVDVTNFVLMELGQPLHAFDYDALEGKQIIVRNARAGEKIIAIDGKTYALDPSMFVIADSRRPVAVAGVMGGKEMEVTEKTINILLESARFDPLTIRTQARALSLMSDSSYRFERGIDPLLAQRGSLRATQIILEVAGGTAAKGVVEAGALTLKPLSVELRLSRIAHVLGIEIPTDRVLAILSALEFQPQKISDAGIIRCSIPTHRLDITREIDLVEEVARVYGYQHVVPHDRVAHPVQPEPAEEKAGRVIRRTLEAAGFNEALTVTLTPEKAARQFLPAADAELIATNHAGWKGDVLRPSLLPSLLAARRTNQNAGTPDARLYEHAEGFWQQGNPTQSPPYQRQLLALVGNCVSEVKAAIQAVLERLAADTALVTKPRNFPWFEPGIAAELFVKVGNKQQPVGSLGQFSATIQQENDLRQEVAGAELYWDVLIGIYQHVRRAKPLPRFPGIRRDLSVVLQDAVRWSDVETAVQQAGLQNLQSIDFVGTFRNKQIGAGKKSLTLTLEFRDPSATLRSEQVDEQMKTALETLSGKLQATLRA